jgi:biotin-independent malonate decarboxylase gamma subunit
MSRGLRWLQALAASGEAARGSVRCVDVSWNERPVRLIAVVPNPVSRFPRARGGQVGIEEGWAIAAHVRDAMAQDEAKLRRALVLVIDVPGQAFGYHEEALALHESLAAAVDAYASARLAGHPVVGLIVGKAISGAFLAHGLQAGALLALDDAAIEVHVMSQASVARVTRRSEEEVAALAKIVPSTARDVHSFASLGALDSLLSVNNADAPTAHDAQTVRTALMASIDLLRSRTGELRHRLETAAAKENRALSITVRKLLEAQWDVPPA